VLAQIANFAPFRGRRRVEKPDDWNPYRQHRRRSAGTEIHGGNLHLLTEAMRA